MISALKFCPIKRLFKKNYNAIMQHEGKTSESTVHIQLIKSIGVTLRDVKLTSGLYGHDNFTIEYEGVSKSSCTNAISF